MSNIEGSAHRGQRVLIYGHRGAPRAKPENTLAAFKAAIDAGVDGIELDVLLSRDGVPIVMHDDTLDRTTNGVGRVADLDFAKLRLLDAGAGERIPSLHDVLVSIPEWVHLDIEIKGGVDPKPILAALRGRDRSTWAISSFAWEVLREARGLDSALEIWVLTTEPGETALWEARALDATTLAVEHSVLDGEAATRIHLAGFDIMCWTVNDLARARELIDLGVRALCTDVPGEFAAALGDGRRSLTSGHIRLRARIEAARTEAARRKGGEGR
jgi:glycerophosphoryl diester phosphodiesterase